MEHHHVDGIKFECEKIELILTLSLPQLLWELLASLLGGHSVLAQSKLEYLGD